MEVYCDDEDDGNDDSVTGRSSTLVVRLLVEALERLTGGPEAAIAAWR